MLGLFDPSGQLEDAFILLGSRLKIVTLLLCDIANPKTIVFPFTVSAATKI